MTENAQYHWTEDDGLLSEYALGRLPAEVMKRLEAHLEECDRCQEAVRRERTLMAGIRQHARGELKSRLGTLIAQRTARSGGLFTWQRVVAAAAVIVIVFGVGILEGWFTTGQRGVFPSTGEPKESGSVIASHSGDTARQLDAMRTAKTEGMSQRTVESDKAAGPPLHREREEFKKTDKDLPAETGRDVQRAEVAAETGVGEKNENAPMAEMDKKGKRSASDLQIQELWSEGSDLSPSQVVHGNERPSAKLLLKTEPSMQQQQQGAGGKMNLANAQGLAIQQGVEFRQSRMELLPASRQKLEDLQPSQVQTLFRRARGGTDITFYLDTLFSEKDLRDASIVRVSPDSVVITVKSRILGYRLPAEFLDSIAGPWKKE